MNETKQRNPKVVTYTSTAKFRLDICPDCEREMRERGEWPKDGCGNEFATVSHGLHLGACETCNPDHPRNRDA